MRVLLIPAILTLSVSSGPAQAQSSGFWQQDPYWNGGLAASHGGVDDTVRANVGIGLMYLEGNEKVLSGDYTVSHLIWQSLTPVLRGSLSVDVGGGFTAGIEASTAGFGGSYMEDYDWLKGDDTFENWSHRSQHADTRLDHYFTGAATLGYELVNDASAVIRAHGGIKYTDVQWTAHGGTYTYSSGGGFRDISASIADGVPGITYRQQLPELFLGVDGEERYGNFRIGGLLRGGVTFLGVATDDHYLRVPPLHFVDSLWMAPTFTAGMDIGFALGRNAELTLAARYDHIFEQRGDSKVYDANTNTLLSSTTATAGGALRSAEITAGLKGLF